tara:strand:+ start:4674 stop:5270 length:597 start_codon:yes stop_codon:yes gene_type:complete
MKNLFILLFTIFITFSNAKAQQGSFLIGASSDIGDRPVLFWGLTPTLGYFISDNICLGAGLKFNSYSQEDLMDWNNGEYNEKGDSIIINPFVRYYTNNLFVHGGINISSSKNTAEFTDIDYETEISSSSFGLTVGVGYSLKWGKHFVFEPMFGYNYSSGGQTIKNKASDGTVNEVESDLPSSSNLGLTLGISFLIGDK